MILPLGQLLDSAPLPKLSDTSPVCQLLNFCIEEILLDRRICQGYRGFAIAVHGGKRFHEDQCMPFPVCGHALMPSAAEVRQLTSRGSAAPTLRTLQRQRKARTAMACPRRFDSRLLIATKRRFIRGLQYYVRYDQIC